MGINRQSAYDTFGDKRQLFLAALDGYATKVGTEMKRILTDGPSPVGRIRLFLRTLAERAPQLADRGCLMTNTIVELAPHDSQIRAFVSTSLGRLESALTATLTEAVRVGELPPTTHPRRTARLLLTIMQGALVLSKTNLADTVREALESAEEVLLAP
jgi:AcrR family transcriptional regulator